MADPGLAGALEAPLAGSRAVLAALRSLQEKIRRLEAERNSHLVGPSPVGSGGVELVSCTVKCDRARVAVGRIVTGIRCCCSTMKTQLLQVSGKCVVRHNTMRYKYNSRCL